MALLKMLTGRRKWILFLCVFSIFVCLQLFSSSPHDSALNNSNLPVTQINTAAVYRDSNRLMLNGKVYHREEPTTTIDESVSSQSSETEVDAQNETKLSEMKLNMTDAPVGSIAITEVYSIESESNVSESNVSESIEYESNVSESIVTEANISESNVSELIIPETNVSKSDVSIKSQSNVSISNTQYHCDNRTMLVLLTTFKDKPDRVYPQSQIILNWAQFRPWIQPVLYSPDKNGTLVDLATQQGWHIYEEQGGNSHHTPYLKPMFAHAMEHYNVTFHGFANGDIMFNSGLIDTVKYFHERHKKYNTTLITGKRWNYHYYKYNVTDLWTNKKVNEVRKYSSQFRTDAEDYFITTPDFPWDKLKNVVIGRPG